MIPRDLETDASNYVAGRLASSPSIGDRALLQGLHDHVTARATLQDVATIRARLNPQNNQSVRKAFDDLFKKK